MSTINCTSFSKYRVSALSNRGSFLLSSFPFSVIPRMVAVAGVSSTTLELGRSSFIVVEYSFQPGWIFPFRSRVYRSPDFLISANSHLTGPGAASCESTRICGKKMKRDKKKSEHFFILIQLSPDIYFYVHIRRRQTLMVIT